MLFSFVFAALIALVAAQTNTGSNTIGSLVVKPLDYGTYGKSIDLQLVRFTEDGTVYFYDTSATNVSRNSTLTVSNAQILNTGRFITNGTGGEFTIDIDPVSGLLSATQDSTSMNGMFYVQEGILYFNYRSTFVACRSAQGSSEWNLWWRGASSAAVCENDWLLVNLYAYGASSGAVSEYKPNNYETSVAETVVQNTATTTATVGATNTATTSVNGAGTVGVGGAIAAVAMGLLL